MVASPENFLPRRRRPSASCFVSPKLSDVKMIQSLLLLSQEISSMKPLPFLVKRNSASMIHKSMLLSVLLEELLRNPTPGLPHSAILCFEEMYIVLQRIKFLIEDCSNGSKMWLLMQHETVANSFHELKVDLSTLMDVFPANDLDLNEDIKELILLIGKQCNDTKHYVDPCDQNLRFAVLEMLDRIKEEIVPDPSKLAQIFNKLGLRDSSSCRDEIESLEEEVQIVYDHKSKAEVIALIGLVRYAKCVLFGASTPRSNHQSRKAAPDIVIPMDFRCPISLDLLRDPVVVATGQTYDRPSINQWIASGHNTCPKTGQALNHTNLIPNVALRNLIALWCRDQRIPFKTEESQTNDRHNRVAPNKAAIEATKMTASFLVNELSVSESPDTANRVVHELRVLAKTDSDSRACIADAGSIPLLVKHFDSDHPNLQVNAVTTILNLSILDANKTTIMETDGAINGIAEVLRSGATWEAKGNAAATIFSLSGVHSYRKRLGRKTRIINGLVELAKAGPTGSKRDAMLAILNLAGDRETVGKLVDEGIVAVAGETMESLPEEAVAVMEAVVKRGGFAAVTVGYHVIKKLAVVLRNGSDRARESAAATLVSICRKGGTEMAAELAATPGIERVIWDLMATGTARARRKAATLMRILRRWTATQDENRTAGNAS